MFRCPATGADSVTDRRLVMRVPRLLPTNVRFGVRRREEEEEAAAMCAAMLRDEQREGEDVGRMWVENDVLLGGAGRMQEELRVLSRGP